MITYKLSVQCSLNPVLTHFWVSRAITITTDSLMTLLIKSSHFGVLILIPALFPFPYFLFLLLWENTLTKGSQERQSLFQYWRIGFHSREVNAARVWSNWPNGIHNQEAPLSSLSTPRLLPKKWSGPQLKQFFPCEKPNQHNCSQTFSGANLHLETFLSLPGGLGDSRFCPVEKPH